MYSNKEEVLNDCRIVDKTMIKLPNSQLEPKLYAQVKKSLMAIGGKWKGGKTQAFIFQSNPTDLLQSIASGEKRNLKKEFQFFATPPSLAKELVRMAAINEGNSILEPSCGQGAIIEQINLVSNTTVDCYELMPNNITVLKQSKLNLNFIAEDFLKNDGKKYDRIIANPPFTKNKDIIHVKKMYEALNEDGRIVSVTSESWYNGSQKKQLEFKQWLDDMGASIYPIEKGTFKDSGTMVGGYIVVIDK